MYLLPSERASWLSQVSLAVAELVESGDPVQIPKKLIAGTLNSPSQFYTDGQNQNPSGEQPHPSANCGQKMNDVSSHQPDWSREHLHPGEWNPGKRLIACIRDYQRLKNSTPLRFRLFKVVVVLRHRFWSAITGADIPLTCQVGGGLLLPHPNGIVVHPDAHIGPNCLIFQQVTLGTLATGGAPVIGGHVDIGAGAKVLGNVVVGNHVVVGANAVVLKDVPSGAVAVGIPAEWKYRGGKNDRLD